MSQGVDTVTFDADGQNIDVANQLNFGDKVVIYKNGVPWFQGSVTKTPVKGSVSEENHSYEVSGPWYYFENQIFEQTYLFTVGSIGSLTPPAAAQSSDYTVVQGNQYAGTDGHYHYWPSSLFTVLPNQSPTLLVRASDGVIFGTQYNSHIFLNSWIFDQYGRVQRILLTSSFGLNYASGVVMDTGQQITQALQNAQAAQTQIFGSPSFQMGAVQTPTAGTSFTSQAQALNYYRSKTISPSVPAAITEQRDITVAEVIRNQLRWSPDAVTWFDYTVTPPMFYIGQRSSVDAILLPAWRTDTVELTAGGGNLAPTVIPVTNGLDVADVAINPRYDLQPPFVRITYEQTNVINGLSTMTRVVDQYPTNAPQYGMCAMVVTVNLRGYNSGAYSPVTVASIPAMTGGQSVTSGAAYNWWTARKEWPLHRQPDVVIDSITLNARNPLDGNNNPINVSTLPNELISGQISDWMGVTQNREQITATLYYHTLNGQQFITPIQTTLQSTNSVTGTYNDQSTVTYAEPVPIGLAEYLYNAVSALQYDGQITIIEDECTGIIQMGQVLNLSPEWEDMNAMIVQIDENVDQGTTQIAFGPKKNLGASDLVELVRVIRNRYVTPFFSDSYGGSSAASIGIGQYNPVAQADHNGATPVVLSASQVTDPNGLKAINPYSPQVTVATLDANVGQMTIAGRSPISANPSTGSPAQTGDGNIKLALADTVPSVGGTPTAQNGRFRPIRIANQQQNMVVMAAATDPMSDSVVAQNGDPVIGDGVASPAVWL